jgi:superfamily II DNA or RNA helicase
MQPRWYQQKLINGVRNEWAQGHANVLAVSPPRSGKTPTAVWLAEPFIAEGQRVMVGVHRDELVKQIANTFAKNGHLVRIIASAETVAGIVMDQVVKFGKSFVSETAKVTVGSVATISARATSLAQWANRIKLWIVDEAHHVLANNTWGKVVAMFSGAFGLGFTATPARADRKSLARSQGGVFDAMVKGAVARQLIDEGFICDYDIVAPPSSIDRESIKQGSTGEFQMKSLSDASRTSSKLTGDCVKSYQQFANGKQAVLFAVDISHAEVLTQAYNDAGIPAQLVHGKMSKSFRRAIMEKFEKGVFRVLINVDLFGEGLDMAGIEVVIMARSTMSYTLFVQQFFRALTMTTGKGRGLIIDHVGNVGHFGKFYGLPDTYNGWTLETERTGKRAKRDPDTIPVTTCTNMGPPVCGKPYESTETKCPHCGFEPQPTVRSGPQHVDGDLEMLDAETLALLRGNVIPLDDEPNVQPNDNSRIANAIRKKWHSRQEAQLELRQTMAIWSAEWHDKGESDRSIQKRFYFNFGVDMVTAQGLGSTDAINLKQRILGL